MKTFDPTKPAKTVDGREAEFLRRINDPKYPLLFLITERNGSQWPVSISEAGRCNSLIETATDLINIPEKRVVDVWVNVYAVPENDTIHETAMGANEASLPDRLTCIHKQIEIEVPA